MSAKFYVSVEGARQGQFKGQAPALIVVEQAAAFTELFFEDLVFGAQVVDDLLLLTVHPACEDKQKKLPGLQDEAHVNADEE